MSQLSEFPHKQVWVKVNAQVDEGMVELVSAMNEVPGLETVESCQGDSTEGSSGEVSCAFVYFFFGDWQQISELAFNEIAPALSGLGHVQVDRPGDGRPMGKIVIFPGSLRQGTDALLQVFNRHMLMCSHGKVGTVPRSY